jgi:hypothetical protein
MAEETYTTGVIERACAALSKEFNPQGIHVLPVSEYNALVVRHDEAYERAEHFEEEARQYRKKVLELVDDSTLTDLRLSLQGLVHPDDGPRPGFEYLDVDTNTAMVNGLNSRGGANRHQRRHVDAKLGRIDAGLDRGKTHRLLPIKERE